MLALNPAATYLHLGLLERWLLIYSWARLTLIFRSLSDYLHYGKKEAGGEREIWEIFSPLCI